MDEKKFVTFLPENEPFSKIDEKKFEKKCGKCLQVRKKAISLHRF